MAKYLHSASGRRIGVRLSVREYNNIRFENQQLRTLNVIQEEVIKRKKVVMVAPQQGHSIWHPN